MVEPFKTEAFIASSKRFEAELERVATPQRQSHRFILNNGLRLVLEQTKTFPLTGVSLIIKTGCLDDRSYQCRGAAHLAEHLTLRQNRFPKELQWLRAELRGRTFFDRTEYSVATYSKNLGQALAAISCVACRREFDESSFKLEKEIVDQESELLNQHDDEVLSNLFWDLAFPSSDTRLTAERQAENTFEDLKLFYDREYIPSNMICSLAGDLSTEDIERAVEEAERIKCAEIPGRIGPQIIPSPTPDYEARPNIMRIETSSRITRCLSGYSVDSFPIEKIHELDVLATFINMRTKSLVADDDRLRESLLSFNTFFYQLGGKGLLLTKSMFKPEVAQQLQDIHQQIVSEMKTERVSETEIALAKAQLVHKLFSSYFMLNRARELARKEFCELPPDFDALYIEAVKGISGEDILRSARKYLNDAKWHACFSVPRSLGCNRN